jgi:hypothetical protein
MKKAQRGVPRRVFGIEGEGAADGIAAVAKEVFCPHRRRAFPRINYRNVVD